MYVEQLADVQLGNAFRVASLVKGANEAVGGVVVARTGVNTKALIDAVKARIAQIAAGPAGGREDRAVLRPLDAHRAGHRHAASRPGRRDRAGDARARRLPDALPVDPDRHDPAAAGRAPLVPRDVLRRHLVEHHEPRRHRDRDRRARRRRHRRHRERLPVHRAARRRSPGPPPGVADRSGVDAARRPAGVLLDGHHPAGVHPGVRAHRPGRQALPPAGVHEDVRGAGGDRHRGHAGAGALQPAARRQGPQGGRQPGDARAAPALPAGAGGGARASRRHGVRSRRCSSSGALFAGARHRQRVHAAAQRRRPDVHADRRSEHLARGEHQDRGEAERHPAVVPRGRVRRRQGRARRHLDRPRAAEHDRDDRAPQAARPVACRA